MCLLQEPLWREQWERSRPICAVKMEEAPLLGSFPTPGSPLFLLLSQPQGGGFSTVLTKIIWHFSKGNLLQRAKYLPAHKEPLSERKDASVNVLYPQIRPPPRTKPGTRTLNCWRNEKVKSTSSGKMTLLLTQPAVAAGIWLCRQPAPRQLLAPEQPGRSSPQGTHGGHGLQTHSTARRLRGHRDAPLGQSPGRARTEQELGGRRGAAPADLCAWAAQHPRALPKPKWLGYIRAPEWQGYPSLLTNSTQAQLRFL